METAPARIISRAQTVAKMGLLMKKSTKLALPLSGGGPAFSRAAAFHGRNRSAELAGGLDGHTVDEELSAGDDHFVPWLQAAGDRVVVPDRVAQRNRALLGDGPAAVACSAT